MAGNKNQVVLMGHIGRDPETRSFPNGDLVCNFRIATTESWKDRNTGEHRERTDWHAVSTFGKLAEICSKLLKKGMNVYIEGRLRTRTWEKDGETRYVTEVLADEMQILSSKKEGANQDQGGQAQKAGTPDATDDNGWGEFQGDAGK